MNTYIGLIYYTHHGLNHMKDKSEGGVGLQFDADSERFAYFFLANGRYDSLTIFQAVDDDKAADMVADLCTQQGGQVRCELMRAYDTDICENQRNLPLHNSERLA